MPPAPRSSSARRAPARRGVAAIFTVLMLVALIGMVSLGVDLGRVYAARSELQTAADSAARAAAAKVGQGASVCRAEAVDVADDNTCDGSAVVLLNTDVEFGNWDTGTRTFTPVSGSAEASATAVRVTARRAASRGTAVPLTFASLIGKPTFDLRAVAVAVGPTTAKLGLTGIDSVTFNSNARTDSYDSSTGAYSTGSAGSAGSVYSNGDITLKSNAHVSGDARPGPGKTVTGGTVTGSRAPATSLIPYPPVDATAYQSNNNNSSIPLSFLTGQDFSMDNTDVLDLPAGTYAFRNFSINGNSRINISGPVIIYLTGTFLMDSNAILSVARPRDFRVNVDGAGSVTTNSNGIFTGVLYAPESPVHVDSNGQIFGAIVGKTLHVNGSAKLHFDESLLSGPGSQALRLVH